MRSHLRVSLVLLLLSAPTFLLSADSSPGSRGKPRATRSAASVLRDAALASTPTWVPTGGLRAARTFHAATILNDGRVLIAGGSSFFSDGSDHLSSAEVYDPVTGNWTSTGSMNVGRSNFTLTLLGDGRVLAVGGNSGGESAESSCEIYDPGSGQWSSVASLAAGREGHTATALNDGTVMVAGGSTSASTLDSVEIYDPVANTWSPGGNLVVSRSRHSASLLSTGKVLVAAGYSIVSASLFAQATCELYDPATKTSGRTGSMPLARYGHPAVTIPSPLGGNRVLVAGGADTSGAPIASVATYEPSTGVWTPVAPLNTARQEHTATLLSDGSVLVAGGQAILVGATVVLVTLNTAEVSSPPFDTWSTTPAIPSLITARKSHTATRISSGRVLVAGGSDALSNTLSASEIYVSTCPVISVGPAFLPDATVGTPYSQALTSSGGTPPRTFDFQTLSVIPPGLALSPAGVLSGTPTAEFNGAFGVQVTDAAGCIGTMTVRLRIVKPCPKPAAPRLSVDRTNVTPGQSFRLSWDNALGTEPGSYQIWQSMDGSTFSTLVTIPSASSSPSTSRAITKGVADSGHRFGYEVRALASCGQSSAFSNVVTVSVGCSAAATPQFAVATDTAPAGTTYTVNWSDTLGGAGQYILTISRDDGSLPTEVTTTAPTYAFATACGDAGHVLTFHVTAEPLCGAASAPSAPLTLTATATTKPDKPEGGTVLAVSGAPATGVDRLKISWSAVTPTPTSYRWMLNGGPPQEVPGTVTEVSDLPPVGGSGLDPLDPITLSVEAIVGCSVSDPAVFTFPTAPPGASFEVSGQTDLSATFTEDSSPEGTSWVWLFGDGSSPSIDHSVTHAYAAAGIYNVWLIASNGAGSTLVTKQVPIGLAATSATALGTTTRAFDASNPERQTLDPVTLAGLDQTWLSVRSLEEGETIVFLRFLDSSGTLIKERRLSISPGRDALYDLAAYGLHGSYALELVSMQKFSASITERGAGREPIVLPRRRGPARTEDLRE